MDYSKIANEKVKNAMKAWQNGDKKAFLGHFVQNPNLTDDGKPRDFKNFVEDACGVEKYLDIDGVENNGTEIFGKFQAGHWGTFRVYFKFHQNRDGDFDKLDIGQVGK